jgi:DNA replication protein DnaD
MPLCAFGDARLRMDYTRVENAFVRNFMPSAPGDAVKVYLYGLMQCQHGIGEGTLSSFAAALSLGDEDVEDAFSYWQECGLVTVSHTPSFSVLYQSAQHALPLNTSLYTQSALHAQFQSLFLPSPVTPSELRTILEWVDVFGISAEAVVMLIMYGRGKMPNIEKATVSRQIRYIDRIARQWADEGVRTAEQAETWLQSQQQHQSGLSALLQRLGLHRNPTAAERKLYQKWLANGFTDHSILLAADRTTGLRNPSLDSVDNILCGLKQQGVTTPEQVIRENSEALCKEALTALGFRQPTPSATQLDAYRAMLHGGAHHEQILLACELCRDADKRSLKDVAQCLERWRALGLADGKSIRAHERTRVNRIALLEQAFSCMGLNKRVLDADLAQYENWAQWKLPDELILFAAESAHGANSPYRMMKKLLENWHAAGIRTVAAARKEMQNHAPHAQNRAPHAQNPALRYPQRPDGEDPHEGIRWI